MGDDVDGGGGTGAAGADFVVVGGQACPGRAQGGCEADAEALPGKRELFGLAEHLAWCGWEEGM